LTGIDISLEQVQIAKSKGFNAIEVDVVKYLEQNSEKWDIVFALDFIEHFNKEELIKLFMLINQNLTDEGLLVIRTPNGEGLFPNSIIYGDLTHQTIFNQNSIIQLLSYSNFSRQFCFENAPVSKNLKGIIRLLLWRALKMILNFIRLIETGQRQKLWTRDFYCLAKK
jgi:2-polyprenyl-3-methyl-5-hydroxy-6-metoxy-1,4-benzoquinol methylase